MKLLGILLIAVGAFTYLSLIAVLAGYMPGSGTVDFVSLLSPLLPIGIGILVLRKVRARNVKRDGFSL